MASVCFDSIGKRLLPGKKYPNLDWRILPITSTGGLVVANALADGTVRSMDNDIGLVFSSDGFGFVDGGGLFPMF